MWSNEIVFNEDCEKENDGEREYVCRWERKMEERLRQPWMKIIINTNNEKLMKSIACWLADWLAGWRADEIQIEQKKPQTQTITEWETSRLTQIEIKWKKKTETTMLNVLE